MHFVFFIGIHENLGTVVYKGAEGPGVQNIIPRVCILFFLMGPPEAKRDGVI